MTGKSLHIHTLLLQVSKKKTMNPYIQEVFHVYLNKFKNAVTHLFLLLIDNQSMFC